MKNMCRRIVEEEIAFMKTTKGHPHHGEEEKPKEKSKPMGSHLFFSSEEYGEFKKFKELHKDLLFRECNSPVLMII